LGCDAGRAGYGGGEPWAVGILTDNLGRTKLSGEFMFAARRMHELGKKSLSAGWAKEMMVVLLVEEEKSREPLMELGYMEWLTRVKQMASLLMRQEMRK
jgi:hypothetical protein